MNAPSAITKKVHNNLFENINKFKVTVLESAATDFASMIFKNLCKHLINNENVYIMVTLK